MMQKITIATALLAAAASACGYSSRGSELIGQVKKVEDVTPIICGDYVRADISLGVMKNGVGSMSHEDVWVYVPNPSHAAILKQAVTSGDIVKVTYDRARIRVCVPEYEVTNAEITK